MAKNIVKKISDLAMFPEENPSPVMRVSKKGVLLYANQIALELLSPWQCVVDQIVPDFIYHKAKNALEKNVRLSLDVTYSDRVYALALVPFKERGYVNFYGQDVTENRRAIEQLSLSESRYRELVENANSAIIRWKANGSITFFNEYAQKLFGYKSSEVLGRHVGILLPTQESTGEDLSGLVQKIVAHPEDFISNINENICKHGKRVWMAWTNKPIYNDNGEVREILAIGTDVTNQKMTEEALRESEQRFHQMADFMPQLVWTADPSGKVDYYNERRNEFEGFSQKADGSWEWAPVVHPEDQEDTIKAWEVAYQTGAPYEIEHRVKLSDGNFSWFLSRAFPIRNERGEIVKWFGTATDIDTIKQAEIALVEARQIAEEASQAKSDFLATVSHEIRTPLSVFMSSVEFSLEINNNPKIQEALELAETSSNRLNTLLGEILDFSKIEASQMVLDNSLFDLAECVDEVVKILKTKAEFKGLQLKFKILHSVPNQIFADRYRLGQILLNLVGNAIKFTKTGLIAVNVSRDKMNLIFKVSDTGIGIPKDQLPYIFDTFRQVDSSSSRSQGGVGLGLSIVKGLVELMDGTIEVESVVGKGSVFTFTIPLITEENI